MENILVSSTEIFFSEVKAEMASRLSPENIEKAEVGSKNIVVRKIVYKSNGHNVVGFMVEPKNPSSEKLPCIIYNRGGSREFGAISPQHLFFPISRMAQWGYIVIASQYSGNRGSEGQDEFGGGDLDDVLNLREVLKLNPLADINKIGMWGGSRGGMMTYLSLAKVAWIKAAVSAYGLADLVKQAMERPEMETVMQEMFGGSLEEKMKRSAIYWADKFCKTTPLLIMHGTADWRVSPLDSLNLSIKLYENKIPHRLVMFEGNDHGLTENKFEAEAMIRAWFDDYLVKEKPLPNLEKHGA